MTPQAEPYPLFDTKELVLSSLDSRESCLKRSDIIEPEVWYATLKTADEKLKSELLDAIDEGDYPRLWGPSTTLDDESQKMYDKLFGHNLDDFSSLVAKIREARERDRAVIVFMGAHLIKAGLSRFLTDLIQGGYVTHVAVNGACLVHDYELNTHGETSEDVQRYIADGKFGLWSDTSKLNDLVTSQWSLPGLTRPHAAYAVAKDLAKTLRFRPEDDSDWEMSAGGESILAGCYNLRVPITAHILIGADINHAHPNFDGRDWGVSLYNDFLAFVESMRGLNDGGVFLNIGSAVTGPEVFLKALSMVRNVQDCTDFTTGVFDCVQLPSTWRQEPDKDNPLYYWRPWKTLLVRTTSDSDESKSHYIRGDLMMTIPELWRRLIKDKANKEEEAPCG